LNLVQGDVFEVVVGQVLLYHLSELLLLADDDSSAGAVELKDKGYYNVKPMELNSTLKKKSKPSYHHYMDGSVLSITSRVFS